MDDKTKLKIVAVFAIVLIILLIVSAIAGK